jgi:hypothetical protein
MASEPKTSAVQTPLGPLPEDLFELEPKMAGKRKPPSSAAAEDQNRIVATCDFCTAVYHGPLRDKGPLTDLEREHVRALARREGWGMRSGGDYCPACMRKAKLKEDLAKARDAWHYTTDDQGDRVLTRADQDGLKRRRHAVQLAIGAFLDWAYAEGIPPEHLVLLVDVVSWIEDLNAGKLPVTMRPAARSKRRGSNLSLDRAANLATACAAVDVLSGGSKDRRLVKEIEQEVAQTIGEPLGAFRSWRKALNARMKGGQARAVYDQMRQLLQGSANPHWAARDLLKKIIWR